MVKYDVYYRYQRIMMNPPNIIDELQNRQNERWESSCQQDVVNIDNSRFADMNPTTPEQWQKAYEELGETLYGHGIQQYRKESQKHKKLLAIAENCDQFEINLQQGNLTALPELYTKIQEGIKGIDRFSTDNQAEE